MPCSVHGGSRVPVGRRREISDRLGRRFEGMTLTRQSGNTVLTGPVRDQSELFGLLQRVSDLGLTLLRAAATDDTER